MDTPPDPRTDLSAAQRIAIALGTAEPPGPLDAVDATLDSTVAPDPDTASGAPA